MTRPGRVPAPSRLTEATTEPLVTGQGAITPMCRKGDDKPDGLPLRSAVLRENGRGSSFKERRLLPLYYELLCRPSHGPQHSPKEPRPDTTTVILIPHSLSLPVSNHTKGWNPLSLIVPPRTHSDVASASCKSYQPQIVSVCCTQTPLLSSLAWQCQELLSLG